MNSLRTLIAIATLVTGGVTAAQDTALLDATNALLNGLSAEQRAETVLPFNSDERLNWHFIPKELMGQQRRLGTSFSMMTDAQRKLGLAVVRAGLSEQGYQKAEIIRRLELVLREMENRQDRDPLRYYFLVFGTPSMDDNWMIRYEGHHLSFSWTFIDGKLRATTPQFLGSNPAHVRIEHPLKGVRVLGAEEDLARTLVNSLGADLRAKAIINDTAPKDILTSAERIATIQEDLGVAYGDLSQHQQGILISVIGEAASIQPAAVTKMRMDKIRKEGLDSIKFAWMGGTNMGDGHYYRVQSKTFLIEYDSTQNEANHVHHVWRDFEGDWGRDLLSEHVAHFHQPDQNVARAD